MTPAARKYWMIAQRRVAGLQPDVAAALLRAFAIFRESLTDAEIQAAIDAGGIDVLFQRALSDVVMDRAFIPLRQRIRQTVDRGFQYAVPDLPKGGKINGVLSVAFDTLDPHVITAVRSLETEALSTLKEETRATVRQATEQALRDGVGPRVLGQRIRDVVGLAPNQEQAVRNYEQALRDGDANALDRSLRDRRFDRSVRKAIAGEPLSEERIATMTDAYRKRFLQHNAETHARTNALLSYKTGQALAWQDARAKGVVPPDAQLVKTWVGVMDDRERPEHVKMEGQTVPIDSPYSNGEMVPGESTYNCRCVSRITVERAA